MELSKAAHIPVRLVCIRYGAEGINIYRLQSLSEDPLPAFAPGAHIDIVIGGETRQYSLLPQPGAHEYEIAVQLNADGRGGSKQFHERSIAGNIYQISNPRNHFPLVPDSAGCVLLAGGIGITPIYSMLKALDGSENVQLYYWSRSKNRTLFLNELRNDPRVRIFHDDEKNDASLSISEVVCAAQPQAHLYCCGPEGMLNAFESAAVSSGRAAKNIHLERFAAQVIDRPAGTFTVRLQRSDISFVVGADETLLEACLRHNVDVPYSCEEGICGACECKVLSGEVDHRDSVLSPEKKMKSTSMIICCSRAKEEGLVLDL